VVNEGAGLVYVGGFDGHLRAIDVETYQERWSVKADHWFWTTPLVWEGTLYAGSLDGKVYAVDATTGSAAWPKAFSTDAPVRAAAVGAGGVLVVVDKHGKVYAIRSEDGSAAVAQPLALEASVLADPVVMPGGIPDSPYVGLVTTSGELVRVEPATLRVVDRKRLSGG
jgi:outer membrane protein assembly factor BamB